MEDHDSGRRAALWFSIVNTAEKMHRLAGVKMFHGCMQTMVAKLMT